MTVRGQSGRMVRYAVVGQGYIAQAAVLPAFAHARRNSRLVALVSGDARKRRAHGRQYDVPGYDYDEYDSLLDSGAVDAVYIALPNDQHRDYTVRAARRGVHVLCEKPLAVDERECEAMIKACRRRKVKLMTAYRYDIGVYCINAARHVFRGEPIEVMAMATKPRKGDAEESAGAILRFAGDRLATFCVSFGTDKTSEYRIIGTKGSLRVEPGYELASGLEHHVTRGKSQRTVRYAKRDQFAPELLYFPDCIIGDRDPEPDGVEGLADVRVIRALYRSARTGRAVKLQGEPHRRHPTPRQEIRRPPVRMPRLVHASPPGG